MTQLHAKPAELLKLHLQKGKKILGKQTQNKWISKLISKNILQTVYKKIKRCKKILF